MPRGNLDVPRSSNRVMLFLFVEYFLSLRCYEYDV